MIRLWSRVLLYVLLVGFTPMMARGQTIPFAGPYDESLSNAKIAGGFLLGLRSGVDSDHFNPKAVGLYISPALAGQSVCVDIHSRDNKYSALNTYRIPRDLVGMTGIFAVDTKFEKLLTGYESRDMAVIIHLDECVGKPNRTILPAVMGHDKSNEVAATKQITVYINEEPGALIVTLKSRNGATGPKGLCSDATRILASAYLSTCVVSVPAGPGAYDLRVLVHGAFSDSDTMIFPVTVPGP